MYKPPSYLVVTYFPTYLARYETYFLQSCLPRWNQMLINSVEVHPQVGTYLPTYLPGGVFIGLPMTGYSRSPVRTRI
jgi:hypothetical protein